MNVMNNIKFYKIHGIRALVYHKNKLLILKRSNSDKNDAGLWDIPGGAVKTGENIFKAIKREVLEETGIKISSISIKDFYGLIFGKFKQKNLIIAVFVCNALSSKIKLNHEHSDYKWIKPKNLSDFKLGRVLKTLKVYLISKHTKPFYKSVSQFQL